MKSDYEDVTTRLSKIGTYWPDLGADTNRAIDAILMLEACLWRVLPNTHTVEIEHKLSRKEDPFEGPGETWERGYKRLEEENRHLRVLMGSINRDGTMLTGDPIEMVVLPRKIVEAMGADIQDCHRRLGDEKDIHSGSVWASKNDQKEA